MFSNEEHDIFLCREILAVNAFIGTKKGIAQRGSKWKFIVEKLMTIETLKFKVDSIAVRSITKILKKIKF